MAEAATTKAKKEKIDKYFEAKGRRKSATARVRLFPLAKKGQKYDIIINEKESHLYWPTDEMKEIIKSPFKITKTEKQFRVTAKIKGGGVKSQSEALRLAISRALLKVNPDFRSVLKKEKFLTRDPRVKERRKFGLKKARKSPQWSKR